MAYFLLVFLQSLIIFCKFVWAKKEFWAMDEYEKLYTSKRLKFFDWILSLLEGAKC